VPPVTATAPGLTAPGLTAPGLTAPGLTDPGLTAPGLTAPGLTTPGLTDPSGLTTPGLTSPGLDPALAPISNSALTAPGEIPISAPLTADPALGTYPILGDPSLAALSPASAAPSGGLISDLSSAANQLGAGQAIDLLKGVLMPAITGAIKSATPGAVPPMPPVPPVPPPPGL
jgi:hypothetical protein